MKRIYNLMYGSHKGRLNTLWVLFIIMLFFNITKAQELPPKPVSVTWYEQNKLNFGTFFILPMSSGGTYTIISGGGRVCSHDIIPLPSSSYSPAIFKVEGLPGTLVSITGGSGFVSYSSSSMTITNIESSPASPFVIPAIGYVLVNIGGTLNISNSSVNPPYPYSGPVNITYIQQ